jgi:two-component system sensor histidine kinase KdpD
VAIFCSELEKNDRRRKTCGAAKNYPLMRSGSVLTTIVAAMPTSPRRHWVLDYLAATAIVAGATLLCALSHWWAFSEANLVMIYMAGVALTAAKFGHGPALAAVAMSVASYSYYFVPPVFAFAMIESQYVITLAVMVALGLVISELTSRLRNELDASQLQERRTAQLYRMTREFGQLSGAERLVEAAGRAAAETFDGDAAIFLLNEAGNLSLRYGGDGAMGGDSQSLTRAHAALGRASQPSHSGEDTTGSATFVAMKGANRLIGALGVQPRQAGRFHDAEELRMLEACANLVALSLERDQLMVESHAAQTQVETEQLRNSLLTSISHDLRTPLATIAVTAQGLIDEGGESRISEKQEVLETIVDETRQLGRQVDNLLDWGRLNSAPTPLARDWQVLDELVGVALFRLRRELATHDVRIALPADFPLLWIADDLMVQVLVNLLTNAARYTPAGSRIEISARIAGDRQEIMIADSGPGIPPEKEEAIFEKFVRGADKVADGRRGLGLGLSICRSIVTAHDGTILARNRPIGGAEFVISLPCSTDGSAISLE